MSTKVKNKNCFQLTGQAGRGFFAFVCLCFLLLGTTALHAASTDMPCGPAENPRNDGYSSVLTHNRECEAPILRSRLGQQLRLNARSARSGSQNYIQRNEFGSSPLYENAQLSVSSSGIFLFTCANKTSSYEFYSRYTLPVRAGPQAEND